MNIGDWLFLIEFGAIFGAVFAFCFWQLRSLDRLDREEAERARVSKNATGNKSTRA